MPRAALFALLVASILSGVLQAQRAGGAFHGNAAGPHVRSGFIAQHGSQVARRSPFLPSSHRQLNNFGYFLPYGDSSGNDSSGSDLLDSDLLDNDLLNNDLRRYQQSYAEAAVNNSMRPFVIPRTPAPLPKAQFIEIPSAADAPAPKMPPPAIFILASGERLETRRFVLSASLLSASIDRQPRNVPLNMLDLQATIRANHERGIDLRIPDDRNEISLSF